ncbi:plasmid mobilization protein [Arundinibacter roseus]|uniref:Mobilization protein n=1 Tax=Arundinibacter roseus TaxID=2070510 RepID=A0A4R4JXW6_9BACT|nr:hypothetical protein [Arundinibacter roseus]TDB59523.1 hypothetical protein EZE20_22215 [Arundinibacter roseus]
MKKEMTTNHTFYKGGRPALPKEQRSEKIIKVRFTKDEYEQLQKRKNTTMSMDVNKFIRAICLDKPLLARPKRDDFQVRMLSLIREMREEILRMGVTQKLITQGLERGDELTYRYTPFHSMVNEIEGSSRQLEWVNAN